MTMCKALHATHLGRQSAGNRVYAGRPSKWGNSFVIGRDGARVDVIAKYHA